MAADMSDPKYWGIITVFYLVILLFLWKFSMKSVLDLFWLKVIISVCALPLITGIIYLMGED